MTALLRRVEEWHEEQDAPPLALFHMKAGLYRQLLDHAVPDTLLAAVMASF